MYIAFVVIVERTFNRILSLAIYTHFIPHKLSLGLVRLVLAKDCGKVSVYPDCEKVKICVEEHIVVLGLC